MKKFVLLMSVMAILSTLIYSGCTRQKTNENISKVEANANRENENTLAPTEGGILGNNTDETKNQIVDSNKIPSDNNMDNKNSATYAKDLMSNYKIKDGVYVEQESKIVTSKKWYKKGKYKLIQNVPSEKCAIFDSDGKIYRYEIGSKEGEVSSKESRNYKLLEDMKDSEYSLFDFSNYKYLKDEKILGIDCIVFDIGILVDGADDTQMKFFKNVKYKVWLSMEYGVVLKLMYIIDGKVSFEVNTNNIRFDVKDEEVSIPSEIKFVEK